MNSNSTTAFLADGSARLTLTNKEIAIGLARAGVPVIPCREAGEKMKSPYTKHGFKDATKDLAQVEAWWRQWPNALPGVVPGLIGALVVDQDVKGGVDGIGGWLAARGDWTAAPTVRSPSGGMHAWYQAFAGDISNKRGALPAGIDIRCDNGFVCLGTRADGAYLPEGPLDLYAILMDPAADLEAFIPPLPPHIIEALKRSVTRDIAPPVAPGLWALVDEREIALVKSALAAFPDDVVADYDSWLTLGMALHHWSGGAAEAWAIWDAWSQRAGNYGCTIEKWESFSLSVKDGVTIATLFHMAKGVGWSPKKVTIAALDNVMAVEEPEDKTEWARQAMRALFDTYPDIFAKQKGLETIKSRSGLGIGVLRSYWKALEDDGAAMSRKAEVEKAEQAGMPYIRHEGGCAPQVVQAFENALLAREVPWFCWGDGVSRIGEDAPGKPHKIMMVDEHYAMKVIGEHVVYARFDRDAEDWLRADIPLSLGKMFLSRRGEWAFPVLEGLIGAPALRPDGSIIREQGYDKATGLYLHTDVVLPDIPDMPTKEDAQAAACLLDDLLCEFPFADDASYAVGMSGLITPIIRSIIPLTPMHAISARAAGSGKSKYGDIVSAICQGSHAAVTSTGYGREEFEKRLGAEYLAGATMIMLDNIDIDLGGTKLCMDITQTMLKVRRLGTSEQTSVVNRACIFANGNNLRVEGDMTRRTIMATLDAQMEDPYKRPFKSDPVKKVLENRGAYIAACMTIVRAYACSGEQADVTTFNNFEAWSRLVREALVWLGYADPVGSIDRLRDSDPEREQLVSFMIAMRDEAGLTRDNAIKVSDMTTYLHGNCPQMEAALQPWLKGRVLNTRGVGRWLARHEQRVTSGFKIASRILDGHRLWFVEPHHGARSGST